MSTDRDDPTRYVCYRGPAPTIDDEPAPASSLPRRTIFKYAVDVADLVTIAMPLGAEIVHIAARAALPGEPQGSSAHGLLTIWAIVDRDQPFTVRRLEIRGTGHPLGDVGEHIATVQDGAFVWHVFETPNSPPSCPSHHPVQHRDGKPPWCKACSRPIDGQASRLDMLGSRRQP